LSYATPKDVDTKTVGIHWTPDKGVASRFAESDEGGVIVHASVHPKHIIDPKSDEGKDYASRFGIDEGWGENETTVREGAPITVHGITSVDREGKPVSTNMFKKPKKGKA